MKKWTVVVLTLAMTMFGLASLGMAGGLESANDQKDMTDLKDQVNSLVQAVNELKQENNLLKAKDAARDQQIASLRSTPSAPQTVVAPAEGLATQLGKIKISGGLIGTGFATAGHEGGGAGTGVGGGSSETTAFAGDQFYGSGAFWLDVEAPVAQNTKIFAELEVNGNSSGVLNQQPYPSLHLPNGIATFSTNYPDGAITEGYTSPRTNNVDLVNLLEVYVESKWFDNRFTTQAGKLDLTNYFDHSRFASSDRNQFVAKGLAVNPALLSTMPLNTPAARVAWSENKPLLWDFFDGYQIQAALASGDDSGRDLFSHMFGIVEGTITTNKVLNRRLDLRAYAYVDGGNHSVNTDKTISRQIGSGIGADYELIPNKLGIFTRFGFNANQVGEITIAGVNGTEQMGVSSAWQVGAEYKGFFKNRPEDVTGLAFSQINIYDNTDANYTDQSAHTGHGKPHSPETFVELYYNYKVNDSIHVTPFAQMVFDAAGGEGDNVAAGVRSQFTF